MKYYVRGQQWDEGSFACQAVNGGVLYYDKSNTVMAFVPDSEVKVFDSQQDLDIAIQTDEMVLSQHRTYWEPLTEGEIAWMEAMKEARPKVADFNIERWVRGMRASGEPLINSFGVAAEADEKKPLVGPRSWWRRFLGID